MGKESVKLYPGVRFCQIEYKELVAPSYQGYDGKYQGDMKVSRSRLEKY